MDFFDKGYACIELIDPKFALDVWKDIDQDEIRRFLAEVSEKPWKALTFPRTPSSVAFVQEIDRVSKGSPPKGFKDTDDQNMYKCWERYGKRWLNPAIVEQRLNLFMNTQQNIETRGIEEHIWVLVPLVPVSQFKGLPTLMEGTHRRAKTKINKPYDPVVQPGQALMFDARLVTHDPGVGGGVVFARAYDVTNM
ncbi:MAG: hypothetical protein ASARMPRED_006145 [Alectoria sarmentosa]|nr:MAG: hypothetical protein ASARMPRED_006145 [Alectoria sarmentosa]